MRACMPTCLRPFVSLHECVHACVCVCLRAHAMQFSFMQGEVYSEEKKLHKVHISHCNICLHWCVMVNWNVSPTLSD